MNEEQIKRIIEDSYDDSKEDGVRLLVRDAYRKKMRTAAMLWGAYCCVFVALAILSAVLFFRADQLQYQIMFAAMFLFFGQRWALVKIIGWQWLRELGIKREIKRLELRIAELNQTGNDR